MELRAGTFVQSDFSLVVSIINYRTADLTIACVQSALADLPAQGLIVVVDNASGDGSDDKIAEWIEAEGQGDRVRLVRSAVNSGFSGGHNLGMAAAPAEFYLILNSDAVLRPGFCDTILEAARARTSHGLFAPQIEHEDGEVQISTFRFGGPFSELIRAAQTGPVTKLLKRRVVALSETPQESEIEWASFACILVRGSMVDAIGPMDEGYFLYFEDAEYCLRARRAGWRIAHVPQARAVHFRGGSGPVKALQKAKKRMPPYFYASRSRFMYQAHGRFGLIAANLLWHMGRGVAYARLLLGGSVPSAHEGEARDIWTNALTPLGPRLAPDELKDTAQ
jgi:GT2 family glycosyltransferase